MFHISRLKTNLAIHDISEAQKDVCAITKNMFDAPTLGLDLDGTLDESPEFFKILSNLWPGAVIIITHRDDSKKAENYAMSLGIYFDKLVIVPRLDEKFKAIKDLGVDVYVDDQDECFEDIPDSVTVLKIRNGGNYSGNKWLYSDRTGKNINWFLE